MTYLKINRKSGGQECPLHISFPQQPRPDSGRWLAACGVGFILWPLRGWAKARPILERLDAALKRRSSTVFLFLGWAAKKADSSPSTSHLSNTAKGGAPGRNYPTQAKSGLEWATRLVANGGAPAAR